MERLQVPDVSTLHSHAFFRRKRQCDLPRVLIAHDPRQHAAVAGAHLHRLVAADETGAWEYDRFEQIHLFSHLSNPRQIRAELASVIRHRVTGRATGFRPAEHRLASERVAARQPIGQLPQELGLIRRGRLGLGQQIRRLAFDGFAVTGGGLLQHDVVQPSQPVRLREHRQQRLANRRGTALAECRQQHRRLRRGDAAESFREPGQLRLCQLGPGQRVGCVAALSERLGRVELA